MDNLWIRLLKNRVKPYFFVVESRFFTTLENLEKGIDFGLKSGNNGNVWKWVGSCG